MKNIVPLDKVESMKLARIKTGIEGFDELIGGGFVPGSAVMLAGEPGMGKSTFLLQVAQGLANAGKSILYISGEESAGQVKMRAERLGISHPLIWMTEDVQIDTVIDKINQRKPDVIIVDSLQMVHEADKLSGTPTQTQSALMKMLEIVKAKGSDKVLITIGHATKSNAIAGRLTLQHMVDAIMFLRLAEEGEGIRLLHVKKNRFGESMVDWRLKMTELGLVDLNTPRRKTEFTGWDKETVAGAIGTFIVLIIILLWRL